MFARISTHQASRTFTDPLSTSAGVMSIACGAHVMRNSAVRGIEIAKSRLGEREDVRVPPIEKAGKLTSDSAVTAAIAAIFGHCDGPPSRPNRARMSATHLYGMIVARTGGATESSAPGRTFTV